MSNTTESELVGLERKYWQALKDHDVDTAVSLTDFPCLVTCSDGVREVDEPTFRQQMAAAPASIDAFELSDDIKVRLIAPDTAVVAYQIHERMSAPGHKIEFDATDSSVWVRKNGRWVCAHHTEAVKGDPFAQLKRQG